jgi:hypothetical protein
MACRPQLDITGMPASGRISCKIHTSLVVRIMRTNEGVCNIKLLPGGGEAWVLNGESACHSEVHRGGSMAVLTAAAW